MKKGCALTLKDLGSLFEQIPSGGMFFSSERIVNVPFLRSPETRHNIFMRNRNQDRATQIVHSLRIFYILQRILKETEGHDKYL